VVQTATRIEIDRTAPFRVSYDDPDSPDTDCVSIDLKPALLKSIDRLAPGTYQSALQRTTASVVQAFATPPLVKPATGACAPPAPGRSALALTITTAFPITVPPATPLEVRFRVWQTTPVVFLQLLVDNSERASAAGDDLHSVSGFWITAPTTPGRHSVAFYVRDAAGCEYRAGGRTITVQ
jgi:hypothetical protein